jgi:hypothetical protein
MQTVGYNTDICLMDIYFYISIIDLGQWSQPDLRIFCWHIAMNSGAHPKSAQKRRKELMKSSNTSVFMCPELQFTKPGRDKHYKNADTLHILKSQVLDC